MRDGIICRMTLRELRYLIALADRAHFGRAAEDCHISQPTLSTQIRKLEEYLGVSLIERNTKSVSLTPMGEEVVRSARQIVSQADALLAATRVPRGPLEGRLSIGVIPTLGLYFLPSFIPLTKSHYPQLQLAIHEDLTQHLLERLRNYQIDAALLALPLENQDLECLPLFDEPFWFACSRNTRSRRLNGSAKLICAMRRCCCWPMDIVCVARRWPPVAGSRSPTTVPTTSAR